MANLPNVGLMRAKSLEALNSDAEGDGPANAHDLEELMETWSMSKAVRKNSAVVQAVLVGAVAYTSGVVVNLVTQHTEGPRFWLLVSGGFVACVTLTCAVAAFESLAKADREKRAREIATYRSGYQTLNREISQYIALIRRCELGDVAQASVRLMHNACRDLYETLETEYGLGVSVSEHIEFEVTFMTCSLIDGEITVAAWANRDARAPKSSCHSKGQSEPLRRHGDGPPVPGREPHPSICVIHGYIELQRTLSGAKDAHQVLRNLAGRGRRVRTPRNFGGALRPRRLLLSGCREAVARVTGALHKATCARTSDGRPSVGAWARGSLLIRKLA